MKRYALLIIGAFYLALFGIARADHDTGNVDIDALSRATEYLETEVRYSTLNYQVKQTVSQFSYDVDRLVYCVERSRPFPFRATEHVVPGTYDHSSGCPRECAMDLNLAKQSFNPVNRYLYDVQYDFPQVYRAYQETRFALNRITVGGPGPGPGPGGRLVKCTAVDSGWEEHGGGHTAYGRSVSEAQRASLQECNRFHGSCHIRSCQNVN
jgi:hypothetical protein